MPAATLSVRCTQHRNGGFAIVEFCTVCDLEAQAALNGAFDDAPLPADPKRTGSQFHRPYRAYDVTRNDVNDSKA